jgi:hypothetical protein
MVLDTVGKGTETRLKTGFQRSERRRISEKDEMNEPSVATGASINSVPRTSRYPSRQTSVRPMRDLPPCDWTERTLIEDSAPFTNTADLVLGDSLHAPKQRHEFGRRAATGLAENWRLRDVTLFPRISRLFKGEQVIEAARSAFYSAEEVLAKGLLTQPHRRLDGRRYFVIAHPTQANG